MTCTATGTEGSTHGYATAVNQLPLPVVSMLGKLESPVRAKVLLNSLDIGLSLNNIIIIFKV